MPRKGRRRRRDCAGSVTWRLDNIFCHLMLLIMRARDLNVFIYGGIIWMWCYNNFCHLMLLMIRRETIIWTWWTLPAQVLRFRHWMWSDEEMLHPGGSRLVFKFGFISSNGQWLDFCFSLGMLCSDILICMFIVQPSVTCNIFVPRLVFGVMKSGPRSAKGVQRLGSRTDPKLLVANFFITI